MLFLLCCNRSSLGEVEATESSLTHSIEAVEDTLVTDGSVPLAPTRQHTPC